SLSFTTDAIDEVRSSIHTYSHREVIADEEMFAATSLKEWDGHRCYTHVYYDPRKVSEEEAKFYRKIDVYYQELRSEKLNPEHQKFYDRFFTIERKQHVGRVVMPNDEAILAFHGKYAGYSVIISNDLKDPVEALMVYRAKDRVEKSFDNLKNDLDGKRLRVRSEWAMEGRMFVQFLSLILASYIQRVMREKDLYKNYTMQSIIEEMKILMRITLPRSRKVLYSELTADQKRICEAFGIEAGA
ncbi:IS1634 family transposase, partial [Methanocorpusculum bavaricum]|uniref:IS1634 family transposase n=1 Tax=Methanocorpusculum bavaricum TaxID=71518 RepID=UPI0012DF0791